MHAWMSGSVCLAMCDGDMAGKILGLLGTDLNHALIMPLRRQAESNTMWSIGHLHNSKFSQAILPVQDLAIMNMLQAQT